MRFIRSFLLFLWELPQYAASAILLLVLRRIMHRPVLAAGGGVFRVGGGFTGVCLGEHIFVGNGASPATVKHEMGHRAQSRLLGPLYLPLVGLPSITRNLWDRAMHKTWPASLRERWYYGAFPENWADRLGKVIR